MNRNLIIDNAKHEVMGLIDNKNVVGSEVILKAMTDDLISRKEDFWELYLTTKEWFRNV